MVGVVSVVSKCPHCGGRIVAKPISRLYLWEGKPFRSRFVWAALRPKNIRWGNLLFGDWVNFFVIVSVLFAAWSYSHDSEVYREFYADPCAFVLENYQVCLEVDKGQNLKIDEGLIVEVPESLGGGG